MHYIDVRYVFDTYVFDNGNLAIMYKGLILYCTYRWKYLHKYTDSLVNINFQKSIISIHKTCRQPFSLWRFCRTGFVSWEKDTDIKLSKPWNRWIFGRKLPLRKHGICTPDRWIIFDCWSRRASTVKGITGMSKPYDSQHGYKRKTLEVAESDETQDGITNQYNYIKGNQNSWFYHRNWFVSGFELLL